MKKIFIITMLLIGFTTYAEDIIDGGLITNNDPSATANFDYTQNSGQLTGETYDYGGTGFDFNNSGTGFDYARGTGSFTSATGTYTDESGFNFNNSGTGFNFDYGNPNNFTDTTTDTPYDPNLDSSIYGSSTGVNRALFDSRVGDNPFVTSNNEGGKSIPKLSLLGIVKWLLTIIGQLMYLIIALALISFLYGILKLSFIDGHKPEAREQARKFMFWGIVSLFVMVSVWGIVNIFKITLFGNGPLIIPELKSTI